MYVAKLKKLFILVFFVFGLISCTAATNKAKELKAENERLKAKIQAMETTHTRLLSDLKVFIENNDIESVKNIYMNNQLEKKTDKYTIPPLTRIGHVHLKVADLKRSLAFYCDVLGFELTMTYGTDAAFVSAGGYHHHIGLNTWTSKNAPQASPNSVGLYHVAILYPTRKDLAAAVEKLLEADYPITGASDHGVSEAIYLNDPDGNGIELYWDKPRDEWPQKEDGSMDMYTKRLDFESLMNELDK